MQAGDVKAGITTDGGIAAKVNTDLAGGEFQAGVEIKKGDKPSFGFTWTKRF